MLGTRRLGSKLPGLSVNEEMQNLVTTLAGVRVSPFAKLISQSPLGIASTDERLDASRKDAPHLGAMNALIV